MEGEAPENIISFPKEKFQLMVKEISKKKNENENAERMKILVSVSSISDPGESISTSTFRRYSDELDSLEPPIIRVEIMG